METRINRLELKVLELEAQVKERDIAIQHLTEQVNKLVGIYGQEPHKTKAYGFKNGKVVDLGD